MSHGPAQTHAIVTTVNSMLIVIRRFDREPVWTYRSEVSIDLVRCSSARFISSFHLPRSYRLSIYAKIRSTPSSTRSDCKRRIRLIVFYYRPRGASDFTFHSETVTLITYWSDCCKCVFMCDPIYRLSTYRGDPLSRVYIRTSYGDRSDAIYYDLRSCYSDHDTDPITARQPRIQSPYAIQKQAHIRRGSPAASSRTHQTQDHTKPQRPPTYS